MVLIYFGRFFRSLQSLFLQVGFVCLLCSGCMHQSLFEQQNGKQETEPLIIYVHPDGNDGWSGRRRSPDDDGTDGPLASLQAAREKVETMLEKTSDRSIEVRLSGGVYRPDQTVVLGPEHSGTPQQPVVWRNVPGEQPIISGARNIRGWRKLDHSVDGLSSRAAEHVYVAELPEKNGTYPYVTTLYDREGRLTRARTGPHETREDGPNPTRDRLPFKNGAIRNWSHLSDVEIFIIPNHPWVGQYLPLSSVNMKKNVARTRVPGTYELQTRESWSIDQFFRVENVPEGLNAPGNWMIDTERGLLYLWPRDGESPESVYAPMLKELIRVEGEADGNNWAGRLTIRGLTFRRAQRMRWPENRTAVQHDWELYDFPNALVRLRNAQDVTVEHCRFAGSGSGGIRADRHAVRNEIRRNEFVRLGGTPISLIGEVPGDTNPNHHNTVAGNRIHHCGQLWWQSSGILIAQSSFNRIQDNHISHMPYTGICVVSGRSGLFSAGWDWLDPEERWDPEEWGKGDGSDGRTVNWEQIKDVPRTPLHLTGVAAARHNRIERNEVHHVMQKLGDGNGIYLSGTGWGNIVRNNYVHDIITRGVIGGIRLDDDQYHSLVTKNVVWKVNGAGYVLKGPNDVVNNIAGDCRRRGTIRVGEGPAHGGNVRRNIFVQPYNFMEETLIPPFYDGRTNDGRVLAQPMMDRNLLWCASNPGAARSALSLIRKELDQGRGSIVTDPQFAEPEKGDFSLEPDSPAIQKLGFDPIRHYGTKGPVGPGSPYDPAQ